MKVHRPQRITQLPLGIEVSSVHYDVERMKLDETCVFFPNGHSEVRGTYDDHDQIVAELLHS